MDYSDFSDAKLLAELAVWKDVNPFIVKAVKAEILKRGLSSDTSVEEEEPKVEVSEEPESVVEEKKKLSKEEAFDLNKNEQVEMLKALGAETIPRLEHERVEMILKLQ